MVPLATTVYPWEAKVSLKSALCAVCFELSIANRLAAREWGTFWASYPVTKVQTEAGARVPTNSAAFCCAERINPGVQRMYLLRQAISALSELRPASISSKSPLSLSSFVFTNQTHHHFFSLVKSAQSFRNGASFLYISINAFLFRIFSYCPTIHLNNVATLV